MLVRTRTPHSKHAVSVYSRKINQRMEFVEHIPDTVAKLFHGLMPEWKFLQLIAKIYEKHRGVTEEKWVPVGGIDISCFYFLHEVKAPKVVYEKKSNSVKEI